MFIERVIMQQIILLM
ncbi:hypothetical protein LINPERPRIM_LOCUS3543 [Linum perenne]